jgi:formyltetrahydrofolate deformylase
MHSDARSILRISCQDQPGIIHEVTGFITARHGNIISLQQLVYRNDNQLFMRLKWTSMRGDECDTDTEKSFAPIADKFKMKFSVGCTNTVRNLALFA